MSQLSIGMLQFALKSIQEICSQLDTYLAAVSRRTSVLGHYGTDHVQVNCG